MKRSTFWGTIIPAIFLILLGLFWIQNWPEGAEIAHSRIPEYGWAIWIYEFLARGIGIGCILVGSFTASIASIQLLVTEWHQQ